MTTKRHRKKTARELPPVGTTLQGKFKGETRTATIIEAQDLPAGKAVEYEGSLWGGNIPSVSVGCTRRAILGQSLLWGTDIPSVSGPLTPLTLPQERVRDQC